jgi:hypothetical protein
MRAPPCVQPHACRPVPWEHAGACMGVRGHAGDEGGGVFHAEMGVPSGERVELHHGVVATQGDKKIVSLTGMNHV